MWQPRFAYASAGVILAALTVVSLPIWLVFYRMADPESNNGAGPRVADLVALSMMLLGGLVTAGAAWVIIIEMRGRVRMVDRLAQTNDRELRPIGASDEVTQNLVTTSEALPATPTSVPATLEASGHLLHSFSRVLRAFSQLPAQVALLAVALSLFVGATLLSMD
ncbi:hypothetical protein [Luedemannella helvata]|uniref:Uncharacterized protein n=1 Tax=Luedemannella helvata TaxID=349315 RepID=A0ABP4X981_9ACTN